MILVVGGACSGKSAYLKERFPHAAVSNGVLGGEEVLLNLHTLPLDLLEAEATFAALCAKTAVSCAEIGCGVVPMDAIQRRRREVVGRLCIRLAQHAEEVVRLQCGIPQRLR